MVKTVCRGESNLRLLNLTKNFMKGLEHLILLDNDERSEEEEVEVKTQSFVNTMQNVTSFSRLSDFGLRSSTVTAIE
jgi:hypothetical protein